MILEFLKRSLSALVIGLMGVGVLYGIWFMYNQVYAPLFINQVTDTTASKQYLIPNSAIATAENLLQSKAKTTNDTSSLPNPFTVSDDVLIIPSTPSASTPGIAVSSQP